MKSNDEVIALKKEFDIAQLERKEFQNNFNNIISSIQEQKRYLNNLLSNKNEE